MTNRKPFQLRKIIIVYNIFQVLLSLKIFYDFCANGWLTSGDHAYSWRCQKIDHSPTGSPLLVSYVIINSATINFFISLLKRLRKKTFKNRFWREKVYQIRVFKSPNTGHATAKGMVAGSCTPRK
jgi:GNS1/SUR4 family